MTDSISVSLSHGKEARMCACAQMNVCVVWSRTQFTYTHTERERKTWLASHDFVNFISRAIESCLLATASEHMYERMSE